MSQDRIDYVEFASRDIEATKRFFASAFGWSFTDHGPDYTSFGGIGLDGGFFRADKSASTDNGSALIVFYAGDLELTRARIEAAGGVIARPVFAFPGGRRFHFIEPGGNEMAVWSDRDIVVSDDS